LRRKVPFSKVRPLLRSRLDLASVAAILLKAGYRPTNEVGKVAAVVVVPLGVSHFVFDKFMLGAVQSCIRAVWELRSVEDELNLHRFLYLYFDLLIE
jgi:hypothetical protein